MLLKRIEGEYDEDTDSWERKLVNEWEVGEDGVHIWIGD